MAQFLRPASDISFLGQTVPSSQPGFSVIDEVVASNTDRMELNHFGTPETWHGALSSAIDPQVHTGHTFRAMAARIDNSADCKLRVELRQGASTVLAFSVFNLTTSLQTFSYTLTSGEAATITDYTALTMFITPTLGSPLVIVSWAEMEIPDAGYEHLDIDGPGLKVVGANSGHFLVADGPGFRRVSGLETPGSGALVLNPSGLGWLVT